MKTAPKCIEIVPGITRVILHYGFMQYPTIYEGLVLACQQGKLPGIDLTDLTYLYRPRNHHPRARTFAGMWVWRESLFAFLQRNAERTAAFFGVPSGAGRGVRDGDRDLGYPYPG